MSALKLQKDLTAGPITRTILGFAFPMILGNLLQQLYNIADTLIVGQFWERTRWRRSALPIRL